MFVRCFTVEMLIKDLPDCVRINMLLNFNYFMKRLSCLSGSKNVPETLSVNVEMFAIIHVSLFYDDSCLLDPQRILVWSAVHATKSK